MAALALDGNDVLADILEKQIRPAKIMSHRANFIELGLSASELTGLLREVLAKGAALRFRATGYSMTPFIKCGDIITLSPCNSTDLHPGDIAAFTSSEGDRLIVHRIVGSRDNAFLTRGDNAISADRLCPKSQLLGSVTRIERNGQDAHFGLGAERKLIAFLSRIGILPFLLTPTRSLLRLATAGE